MIYLRFTLTVKEPKNAKNMFWIGISISTICKYEQSEQVYVKNFVSLCISNKKHFIKADYGRKYDNAPAT